MDKLINALQRVLMPAANKISGNKFMGSLGKTFQLLLPIIMIGSFAVLGAFLNIPAWQAFVTNTGLQGVLMNIQSVTLSLIALYVVIVLPYQYSQAIGINPVTGSAISLMAFLMVTPIELYKNIPMQWLGYPGLFGAMIIGGLVPAFTKFLITRRICIRMPKGVPPIVEDAFASLVPALFVLIITATLAKLLSLTPMNNVHNVIYVLIQTPLQKLGLSFPAYLLMQIVVTLLMFVGVHGNTVFSLFTPITMAASMANLNAYQAGQPLPNIITDSFSVFCQPGGIGGTLGLAFMLLFFAKSKRLRMLGKIAVVPAIFGINEPLIFGIPILLNPLLLIPYLLTPIVCTSVAYIAFATGIVPRLTGTIVNWTMPQFVSGFLAQGWQSMVLQVVLVALSCLIWYPFFRMIDKQVCAEESAADAAAAADAPTVTAEAKADAKAAKKASKVAVAAA